MKKQEQSLKNTPAQYKKEFKWLKEVDSLALANVQLNLQKAYKSFFQSGFGFQNSEKTSLPILQNKQPKRDNYCT